MYNEYEQDYRQIVRLCTQIIFRKKNFKYLNFITKSGRFERYKMLRDIGNYTSQDHLPYINRKRRTYGALGREHIRSLT
jgi:hypothetical protein